MLLANISTGENIFLKNHTVEKLIRRINKLAQWIWQINNYSHQNKRQVLELKKFSNQKKAMQKELESRPGNFEWTDASRTEVRFVPSDNGKYFTKDKAIFIARADPFKK